MDSTGHTSRRSERTNVQLVLVVTIHRNVSNSIKFSWGNTIIDLKAEPECSQRRAGRPKKTSEHRCGTRYSDETTHHVVVLAAHRLRTASVAATSPDNGERGAAQAKLSGHTIQGDTKQVQEGRCSDGVSLQRTSTRVHSNN